MAEWFKKNIIFVVINGLISIVLIIISIGVTRVVSAMDGKAEKTEVALEFKSTNETLIELAEEDEKQHEYIDDQNTKQDEARDKMDELILKRLDYIILRVDNGSSK